MTYAALIYSHSITPRLQYIVDFLSDYYGLPFRLTSDEENYIKWDVPCKINYSYHRISGDEIWIHSHALLFETAVHPVKVECFQHHTYIAFFKTQGDTGFDLLAGTFYLISRYEEYLPFKKDAYGRYPHQSSLAFREGFLHLPLVNIWLEDFRDLLKTKNNRFSTINKQFAFVPTYDIDMAWSYLNKGFKRNGAAFIRLLVLGKWRSLSRRIRVLRGKRQDPFDTYDWLDELHSQYNLKPIYFFLVALQKGKHDKNIDVENTAFRQLIQRLASQYQLALHPSWASGNAPALLSREKKWLEQLVQQPVNTSRQHFIRFNLPVTFRSLLSAGIINDYSMGYGNCNGFRASIATAFYWYDLKYEECTSLVLHPFCFMEATAYYEQKLTAEEALQEMVQYYKGIKAVHGTMVTIWHNSFLGVDDECKGWKDAYLQLVSTIRKDAI